MLSSGVLRTGVKHPPDVELLLALTPPPYRLRVALVVLGLRQKDLCALTGWGPERVSYIINNRHKRGPTVNDVGRIAEVLRLNEELLFPNHQPPPLTTFRKGDPRTVKAARAAGLRSGIARKGYS